MRRSPLLPLAAILGLVSMNAQAWIIATGTVEQIYVYAGTDTILLKLSVAGPPSAACSDAAVFAIDGALPADRRQQLLATVMSAQARQAQVSVAYDNVAGCVNWDASANVYRSIRRIVVE